MQELLQERLLGRPVAGRTKHDCERELCHDGVFHRRYLGSGAVGRVELDQEAQRLGGNFTFEMPAKSYLLALITTLPITVSCSPWTLAATLS